MSTTVTNEELTTVMSDTLESVRAERNRLRAELSERLAARNRAFAAFGHNAVRGEGGKCVCPYCTQDAELLATMAGEYELEKHYEIDKREAAERALEREKWRAAQLHHLVGCVIEALEGYDTDDGHNELVLIGIVAEFKRITAEHKSAQVDPIAGSTGKPTPRDEDISDSQGRDLPSPNIAAHENIDGN